jgi:hypothetical protein
MGALSIGTGGFLEKRGVLPERVIFESFASIQNFKWKSIRLPII